MKYWSELTRKLEPYVPGEQPKDRKYIKLNTNESPYPPSPEVLNAIKGAELEDLRLYPEPESSDLREKVAEYYNIDKDQIFVGNGSDEVLAFSFMAFFDPGQPILYPEISYSFYPVYSSLFNIDYHLVKMNEDFSLKLDGFKRNNGGVIFANPNAPTGICILLEEVRDILDYNMQNNQGSVVIVDEAYIDFGGESAIKLIDEYPNLLVIHTLSKSRALAGMRIGLAFGKKELIDGLNRVKNSFNSYTIDRLAQIAAGKAVEDHEYFQKTRKKIIETRERVADVLRGMGFVVLPSKTNFLFISHIDYYAEELFKALRQEGILVRYFKQERIDNFLRVSIGTEHEMDIFIEKISSIINTYQ
ncbi:MAG: histidinol-phosphate transaminase [Halanaerobiales bacterium]